MRPSNRLISSLLMLMAKSRHKKPENVRRYAHIWGGIPAEDLAAASRVLALVTERVNAELSALTA
ncbi:hypothetical protein ACH4TE_22070 [Streptomyces sioyaensis]|uniref:hypothetical protein n=1 Tax=Streptomyces sioyaensis TaxID=67364 RepID=UPI0037A52BB8